MGEFDELRIKRRNLIFLGAQDAGIVVHVTTIFEEEAVGLTTCSFVLIIELFLWQQIPTHSITRDVARASIFPAHVFVDSDLVVDVQIKLYIFFIFVLLENFLFGFTAVFDQVLFAGCSPRDGKASKDE